MKRIVNRVATTLGALALSAGLIGSAPSAQAHGESRCDNGTSVIWVGASHYGSRPITVTSGRIFFGDFDSANVEFARIKPSVRKRSGALVEKWPRKTTYTERQWLAWNPADVKVPGAWAKVRYDVVYHFENGTTLRDRCTAYAVS